MQGQLLTLGYQLGVDGYFGRGTEAAVRQFQQAQGLPADGIASSAHHRATRPGGPHRLRPVAIATSTVDSGAVLLTQYYLGCLSHASYLIGDTTTGRAVVVDPQRDVAQYLADAEANGLHIERVIETHFHADFVSGHLELAARTGATISYGEAAAGRPEFAMDPLADGQRLSLGEVQLEIRSTPGHTPESISIVVHERPDAEPAAVLTGDTLFIGDVGRPDLLASVGVTSDQLARQLYHSLHTKLLTLPDATRVYPAHGAGSACGKNLSTETVSTIGEQRAANYALAPMTEDEFVAPGHRRPARRAPVLRLRRQPQP